MYKFWSAQKSNGDLSPVKLVKQMKLLRCIRNQKGISLIEILVAMVIFVTGILIVLQIFPGGFSTVRQTEYATIANRLAQSELERIKGRIENLPDGIVAIDPQNAANCITNIDPEAMGVIPNAIAGQEYYFSDANRFRRIIGEATRIPSPMASDAEWQKGSMYMLNFSPVATSNTIGLNIYSNPMRRAALTTDTRWLVWMGNRDYSIDYSNGKIYFRRADYNRRFIISYSYWDQSGAAPRLVKVDKVTLFVDARTNTDPDPDTVDLVAPNPLAPMQSLPVADIPGFAGIEEGTDVVRRAFNDITNTIEADGTIPWSQSDPYEYIVNNAAAGIISFNPYGYDYNELTSSGNQMLTAFIDYDVADWHVIRDERKVPSKPASSEDEYINVKLSLKSLKKAGSNDYSGIAPNLNYSVLAIDTENGRTYNEDSLVDVINAPALSVNFRDGIVGFHKSLHDRDFIILYKAVGDWAVQVFKAYSEYNRRFDIPTDLNAFGYNNYYIGANDRIYFPLCYAGATVAVSYAYKSNNIDTINFVQSESFQISNEVDSLTGLCYIDLKQKQIDSGKTDVILTQVSKVYGTSVGVRTIWRTSGGGLASSWKWKKADIQTYLTRPIY